MNLKWGGFGIALILSSSLLGCSDSSSSKSKNTAVMTVDCSEGERPDLSGIINGKNLNEDSDFAKKTILLANWSDSSKSSGSLCTGSIIDNDTVLTAAHCVDSAESSENLEIIFNSNVVCDKAASKVVKRPVKDFGFHKHYNSNTIENDIAIVVFEGGIPEGRMISKLAAKPLMAKNSKVLAVGYGRTKGYKVEDNRDMRLRFGWLKAIPDDEGLKQFIKEVNSDVTFTDIKDDSSKLAFDQRDQNGVCAGDSGGPAFEYQNGEWLQIGVASFVSNLGTSADACGVMSVHTSVAFHKEWILKAQSVLRQSK